MPDYQTVKVDSQTLDPSVIRTAADVILDGGLVVFPTETVYGLGVDITNHTAVDRVFDVKGRSASKPLLVLIGYVSWLEDLTDDINPAAQRVIDRFWPGPLTVAFRALPDLPRRLLGGGDTIAVRLPDSAVAQALVRAVGRPVTAPSANRSGDGNPLTAGDSMRSLPDDIDLVLDGGRSQTHLSSTLVDVSQGGIRLVREGVIPFSDVEAVYRNHG